MKDDYTYVALLDSATARIIREIQHKLTAVLGYSEYADQWPPHVTISFGNLLSEKELRQIEEEFQSVAKEQKSFTIQFDHFSIIKKEVRSETFYSLRLKIAPSQELEKLSEKIREIAKTYAVPFDSFSEDHFHAGLGRYRASIFDEEKIGEIINLKQLPRATVSGFSIFHSMVNIPRPDRATEILRYEFKG